MSDIRVYIPVTLSRLSTIVEDGGIGPVPIFGHAVTEDLKESYSEGGEEEWEYAALSTAAQDSIGLLTDEDRPRRAVLATDVRSATPLPDGAVTLVEINEVLPLTRVAAIHVDSDDAEADVTQARSKWRDAEEGTPSSQAAVDRCLDHELGWYATQEFGDLVDR